MLSTDVKVACFISCWERQNLLRLWVGNVNLALPDKASFALRLSKQALPFACQSKLCPSPVKASFDTPILNISGIISPPYSPKSHSRWLYARTAGVFDAGSDVVHHATSH